MESAKKQKRIKSAVAAVLIVILSLFAFVGCNDKSFAVSVCEEITFVSKETKVSSESVAVLNTSLLDLNYRGIVIGDTVHIEVGDFTRDMPLVDTLVEEDGTVQLWCDLEKGTVNICIFGSNFMDNYNVSVGDIVKISKVK